MSPEPVSTAQAATRLLQVLQHSDNLSHAQVQALLPDFVEAERAGVHVDASPRFAEAARHLDHCEACSALYTELAEELEQLVGEDELSPVPAPTRPLSTTTRQTDTLVLRVFAGLRRSFEAVVRVPQLAPQFVALSGSKRLPLLSDTLPELRGEPLVSISVAETSDRLDLLIVISDGVGTSRWTIQVQSGEHSYAATTDERGVAHITGIEATGAELAMLIVEADS